MTSPSTTLTLVDSDPAELTAEVIVIGLHSQTGTGEAGGYADTLLLASGAESIVAAFDGRLTETLALLGATGAPGEVTRLATLGTITAPIVAAVGLGQEPTGAAPAPETLRRAAGAVTRALAGAQRVVLS
ncbi:MAG TPA: M17 family peptidase N-terminal domain-containing protein, partial [Micromonosporaceae bacterium]